MAPMAPSPLFPGQDRRSIHSPPRNPPPTGCAGGAWRAGSYSPIHTESARVEEPRCCRQVSQQEAKKNKSRLKIQEQGGWLF